MPCLPQPITVKHGRTFCSRPEGNANWICYHVVDGIQERGPDITIYLAFRNKGMFRSTDAGEAVDSLLTVD